ncbi:hypothetical protein PRIPAC_75356 [Pristionchus pacificus]|nr:hypothetical protein PRIPAC_75356 [Pristionchus pacificus]
MESSKRFHEDDDSIYDDTSVVDTARSEPIGSTLQGRRALSNASLTISKKFHMSRPNLRSISEQESTPGFIPLSGDALSIASSSMSPDNSREVGPSDTPPSRYIQRQTSLRSLFSFTSRSSIKRRDSETGKENSTENIDTPPPISYRFSTQF